MAFLPVGRKELWFLFIFLVSYFLKKLWLPLLQLIQRCLKPANLDWPFPSFSPSSQQSPSLQVSHSTAFPSHSTPAAKRQPLAQLFVSKQTNKNHSSEGSTNPFPPSPAWTFSSPIAFSHSLSFWQLLLWERKFGKQRGCEDPSTLFWFAPQGPLLSLVGYVPLMSSSASPAMETKESKWRRWCSKIHPSNWSWREWSSPGIKSKKVFPVFKYF